MAKRYNRRSTRPLEDIPSLFSDESAESRAGMSPFEEKLESAPDTPAASPDSDFVLDDKYTRPRHKLRFMSLGSGSSGNCAYIGTPECGLLIDAGVDNNFVKAELARNGIDIRTIRGILITHDHSDHVRFCYAIVRRHPGMLLYATPRTLEGMLRRHNLSRRIKDFHSPIFKEHDYLFDDIRVTPFETSHDGTDNVGFAIRLGETTFVVATDMGMITERADFYMRQANTLMIEANYDDQMLSHGRYPEYLKARIRSAIGHMDNAVTARYLTETYRPELRRIFLCHLSHDNNTPETAMATMINSLRSVSVVPATSPVDIHPGSVYIAPLPRFKSSELYVL